MAPMAVPSGGSVPLGVPVSNHEYDLTDADTFNKKGFYSIGANPPPAWSQRKYSAGSLESGKQLIINYKLYKSIGKGLKIHNWQFCYFTTCYTTSITIIWSFKKSFSHHIVKPNWDLDTGSSIWSHYCRACPRP